MMRIGKVSKIIGIIVTYATIGLLIIALANDKNLGLLGVFAGLGAISIIWYIGVSIYSLYDGYKKYLNKKITITKFKSKWFKSLAGCIIIILTSIILFSFSFISYLQDKSKLRDGIIKLEQLDSQVEEYDINEFNELKREVEFLKYSISSNFSSQFLSLLPSLLLIPHIVFLHKTNIEFIKYVIPPFLVYFKNINFYRVDLKKLDSKEITIISLIIGAAIFLLLGYNLGETEKIYYNTQSSTGSAPRIKYSSHKEEIFRFNYATAFAGFIISSGISYLLLNKIMKGYVNKP